jgi:polar amino acid transport system substrate-binding protein
VASSLLRKGTQVLRRLVPAGVLALVLAAAACGGGNAPKSSPASSLPSVSANPTLAALVPADIRADGKIMVGTDTTYAPAEFLATDGHTVTGFDVDLFNAVAAKLGLTAQYQPATFGDIIPGVGSGKYEAGVSAFTINPARKQQVTMVSYFKAGTQWATKTANPAAVDPNAPCGKRIAVQRDTVQVDDITKKSQACAAAGKPAATIDPYPGQDQVSSSVVSGKDDAMLADSPVAVYAVKQANGQLELLGNVYDAALYGYVLNKSQLPFAAAIRGAVMSLIADGSYLRILRNWGVEAGGIVDPQINP